MPLSKMVLKILWVESLSVNIQMKGTEEHFGAGYYALEGCFVNFSLVQFRIVDYEPSNKGIREFLCVVPFTFSFATGKKS